ncbi:MAG: dihydropteridine reductase [Candidatus Gallimonas sp.]
MNESQKQSYAKRLREEYAERKEDKTDELQKLDAAVKRPALIFAFTFGILGALVLGTGMCLAMKIIGDLLPLGIVIGCLGLAMIGANYFLYRTILNRRKRIYGERILSLSDDILNGQN